VQPVPTWNTAPIAGEAAKASANEKIRANQRRARQAFALRLIGFPKMNERRTKLLQNAVQKAFLSLSNPAERFFATCALRTRWIPQRHSCRWEPHTGAQLLRRDVANSGEKRMTCAGKRLDAGEGSPSRAIATGFLFMAMDGRYAGNAGANTQRQAMDGRYVGPPVLPAPAGTSHFLSVENAGAIFGTIAA